MQQGLLALSKTVYGRAAHSAPHCIFFDGLHDHLHSQVPHDGIRLDSGRWASSLIYADDVVLLSWSSPGLQHLLNSMQDFCSHLDLTLSSSKTDCLFNGSSADTWCLGEHALPRSTTFKYLGLISTNLATSLMHLQGWLKMAKEP